MTTVRVSVALLGAMLFTSGMAQAALRNPGPNNYPDPPSPKDGMMSQFQLLSETECVNGHNAGLAAPSIVVIPPALRPPEDKGAPGYRTFISCPEGYLRTAIWNPSNNVYDNTNQGTPLPTGVKAP